jgi:hypothetical protein
VVQFFESYEAARMYRDLMNSKGHALELYSRPPNAGEQAWAVAEYRTCELNYENDLWERVSLELEDLLEDALREEAPTEDDLSNNEDDFQPFWRRPT